MKFIYVKVDHNLGNVHGMESYHVTELHHFIYQLKNMIKKLL